MKRAILPIVLVLSVAAVAQQQPAPSQIPGLSKAQRETSDNSPSTVASDILGSAKTAIAVGDVGWREDRWIWGGPTAEKSQKRLEEELRKWGRFQMVPTVEQADLVLLLLEGSRHASGTGSILLGGGRRPRMYAQLIVFKGGQPPKKFEKPLWQVDEDAGVFSTSAAGKVVSLFRKYLEDLAVANPDRTKLAKQPSSPAAATAEHADAAAQPTVPAVPEGEVTKAAETRPQPPPPPGATPPSGTAATRAAAISDPVEIMRKARTVAIVTTAPRAKAGFWDKMYGGASEQKAENIVREQLSAWNRYALASDPRHADLIFAAYTQNAPSYGSVVIPEDMVEVYEGGAALDRDDPPLWTSGWWLKSMREQVQDIRNEVERDPKQIQPVSNPDAKKLKNPDWRPEKVKLDVEIGDARRLLRKNWAEPGLHNRLGVALTLKRHFNSAVYEFRQALLLKPDYHNAHANLADVLATLGEINGAIVHSWQAASLETDNSDDQKSLSSLLGRKGHRVGSAAETHKENLGPGDWEYHAIIAHALLDSGMTDDAVAEYRRAVEINPVAPHPHDDLGCALLLQGKNDAAIAEFQQATKIEPAYAWGYFNLGRALQAKGDKTGALTAFKQAYALEPGTAEFKAKVEEDQQGK